MWTVFPILWIWHSGRFDYKYSNDHQTNLQWLAYLWRLTSPDGQHLKMLHRQHFWMSTVDHSAFDNDECHMMVFRPISKAAHSWSYDNHKCRSKWRSPNSLEYINNITCKLQNGVYHEQTHHIHEQQKYLSSVVIDRLLCEVLQSKAIVQLVNLVIL